MNEPISPLGLVIVGLVLLCTACLLYNDCNPSTSLSFYLKTKVEKTAKNSIVRLQGSILHRPLEVELTIKQRGPNGFALKGTHSMYSAVEIYFEYCRMGTIVEIQECTYWCIGEQTENVFEFVGPEDSFVLQFL